MSATPEGHKFLRICADRAIAELDAGSPVNALTSVITDFKANDITMQFSDELIMMLVYPAILEGREALEKAVMGFNV